jgi:hypothetical protein
MRPEQAAGYIFEKVVMKLLKESGYVDVKAGELRGRGTSHKIDAYGKLSIPTPFTYPIRLITEAKCYTTSIELHHIRSFLGVIKDISENYIVGMNRIRNTPERYLDTGCIFSASPFSRLGQDFAWAQNIFLVSFSGIGEMGSIVGYIRQFITENAEIIKSLSQKETIKKYQSWAEQKGYTKKYPSIVVGIIDSTYPVILVGIKDWIKRINIRTESDHIETKNNKFTSRRNETIFNLNIETLSGETELVRFNLSDQIAEKLIYRENGPKPNQIVFYLDIPLTPQEGRNLIRRMIRIDIALTVSDKNKYITRLKNRRSSLVQKQSTSPRSRSNTASSRRLVR